MPSQPIFKVSKLLALCENKYRGDTLKYLKYQNLSLSKYYDEYQHWTQCRKKTNELHKTWCKIINLGYKIVMQAWIKPSIHSEEKKKCHMSREEYQQRQIYIANTATSWEKKNIEPYFNKSNLSIHTLVSLYSTIFKIFLQGVRLCCNCYSNHEKKNPTKFERKKNDTQSRNTHRVQSMRKSAEHCWGFLNWCTR